MNRYDKHKSYCRMLGHEVPFTYCRAVKDNLPCSKIMDCWFGKIDIEEYMKENFTEEELEVIFAAPKPKMVSIYDMIKQAQDRNK